MHSNNGTRANQANQDIPIDGKDPVSSKPLIMDRAIFNLLVLFFFN